MSKTACSHLEDRGPLKVARHHVCEACLLIRENETWIHLRTCQTCGVTLCCDTSPNRHALKHFEETGHPVVSSAQPGERWLFCYKDQEVEKF